MFLLKNSVTLRLIKLPLLCLLKPVVGIYSDPLKISQLEKCNWIFLRYICFSRCSNWRQAGRSGTRILTEANDCFCSVNRTDRLCDSPSLLCNGYLGSFLGVKQPEFDVVR